jgi:CRP-like cAMP-binding protein
MAPVSRGPAPLFKGVKSVMLHVPTLTKAAIYCVTLGIDQSLISDLPVFAGLSAAALDDILKRAHARHYAKGVPVFSQNETAHSFFLLLHGRLRVTQVTPHGEQIVVRFVSPGDLFGVAMALGRDDYPGTATAIVDSLA